MPRRPGLLDNEYRFLHADGRIVWVRDQARWVVDERRRGLLRGRLRRCHRAQAGRAGAHAHRAARSAHRPRQPARSSRASSSASCRGAARPRAPCCSSTSTASSSSTTATGMRRATRCCARPAVRLQAALREGDVLSRFGGDEFTAYLPDCDAGSRRGGRASRPGHARGAVPAWRAARSTSAAASASR